MYDQNVLAVLIPCEDKSRTAFNLKQNASRFHKAVGGVAEEPIIGDRDPTPAQLSSSEEDLDVPERIILAFDKPPKNPSCGWQFGTNEDSSDVFLGARGTRGVSSRQYNITIDEKLRIWLHDFHSTHGTAVSYNHEHQDEVRTKETWILSYEPRNPKRWNDIAIISGGLKINVEFPNHRAGRSQYMENLQTFIIQSQTVIPILDILGLDSNVTTAAPSQSQTPRQHPIYLDDGFIGRGTYGEVRRIIKARDGKRYAVKKFIPPDKKRKRDEQDWLEKIQNEIIIMKNNSHVSASIIYYSTSQVQSSLNTEQANVMRVIEFRITPEPFLVMPYYPMGNLRDFKPVSDEQYVSAFQQILLGLSHLHSRGVAHRDLKPENFLVKEVPFTIIIADFGFSKIATDSHLKSFCGTSKYIAPEVFPGKSDSYGLSVDIWSTGVIMLEFIHSLPKTPRTLRIDSISDMIALQKWSQTWSRRLLEKLDDWNENDDKVIDILLHMIKIDPKERFSAEECLKKGRDNGLFREILDGHIAGVYDTQVNASDNAIILQDDLANNGMNDVSIPETEAQVKKLDPEVHTQGQRLLNLSTRSLRFDQQDLVYIIIRKHAVAMRTSDYKMSATGICNAAGSEKAVRGNYMRTFRLRSLLTQIKFKGQKQSWIPFEDGVFLCQAVNLFDELKELFLQAPITVPEKKENYLLEEPKEQVRQRAKLPDGYKALLWDEDFVAYIPLTRHVNATQLLKLNHISRSRLHSYFSENRQLPHYFVRGSSSIQGTYVDFEDARQICRQLNLSQRPIDEILLQERAITTPMLVDHENAAQIYYQEGIHDYEHKYKKKDMRKSEIERQEDSHAKFLRHDVDGSETAIMQRRADDDFLKDNEHIETSLDFQPNYESLEIGSLFASADRCLLQRVNDAQ